MPPAACSKRPLVAVMRASEGAALVSEQLALDQFARDGGHVDRDERRGPAAAVIVQRAGDQLLPGARLAGDHDRQVRCGEAGDRPVDLLHRDRTADQRQLLVLLDRFAGGRQRWGRRERAADHGEQFLQVERLGQVFERAPLRRLHGRHQRGLRAHHHHPQVRADPADTRDQVQPVLVRHDHVGDHEVTLAILHPTP